MTPTVPPVMSDTLIVLTLALLLVAPLAIAGVALINAGLGRSRSAAQALLGNLAIVAVTAIVFAIVGAAFAGCLSASSSHSFHLAGKSWNWLGAGPLFLSGMSSSTVQSQLMLLFEFLAVALAAMLPWGSGADRWRLAAGCASAAVIAAVVFPLAAHWIWNGGWLAQLGVNFALGAGFLDAGGAGAVCMLPQPPDLAADAGLGIEPRPRDPRCPRDAGEGHGDAGPVEFVQRMDCPGPGQLVPPAGRLGERVSAHRRLPPRCRRCRGRH